MKKLLLGVAAIAVIGIAIGFIAKNGKPAPGGQWTQEAIARDPDGYSAFIEKQCKSKIEQLEAESQQIADESARVQQNLESRRADLAKSEPIMDAFLAALDADAFPAKVLGRQYDKDQLRSQINVIVNEQKAARKAIAEFENVRKQCLKAKEANIAMLTANRDELAMIDAKREIFKAGKMTEELSALIADMNSAFKANKTYDDSDPVGSLKTLIERAEQNAALDDAQTESDALVDEALEEYRARKEAEAQDNVAEEPATEEPADESVAEEPATEGSASEPVAEEPAAEEPASEPVVEEPAAEELASEPVVEEPAAEEPASEPVAEEPAADEPTSEPVAEEPASEDKAIELYIN